MALIATEAHACLLCVPLYRRHGEPAVQLRYGPGGPCLDARDSSGPASGGGCDDSADVVRGPEGAVRPTARYPGTGFGAFAVMDGREKGVTVIL